MVCGAPQEAGHADSLAQEGGGPLRRLVRDAGRFELHHHTEQVIRVNGMCSSVKGRQLPPTLGWRLRTVWLTSLSPLAADASAGRLSADSYSKRSRR